MNRAIKWTSFTYPCHCRLRGFWSNPSNECLVSMEFVKRLCLYDAGNKFYFQFYPEAAQSTMITIKDFFFLVGYLMATGWCWKVITHSWNYTFTVFVNLTIIWIIWKGRSLWRWFRNGLGVITGRGPDRSALHEPPSTLYSSIWTEPLIRQHLQVQRLEEWSWCSGVVQNTLKPINLITVLITIT